MVNILLILIVVIVAFALLINFIKKRNILAVPYNTLYFEACSEGKVIDYFLKLKNIDENDRNYKFLEEINRIDTEILYKLQELQMKI